MACMNQAQAVPKITKGKSVKEKRATDLGGWPKPCYVTVIAPPIFQPEQEMLIFFLDQTKQINSIL